MSNITVPKPHLQTLTNDKGEEYQVWRFYIVSKNGTIYHSDESINSCCWKYAGFKKSPELEKAMLAHVNAGGLVKPVRFKEAKQPAKPNKAKQVLAKSIDEYFG